MNQGLDKTATYISGEQLRERFYRPELIQKLFCHRDLVGFIFTHAPTVALMIPENRNAGALTTRKPRERDL